MPCLSVTPSLSHTPSPSPLLSLSLSLRCPLSLRRPRPRPRSRYCSPSLSDAFSLSQTPSLSLSLSLRGPRPCPRSDADLPKSTQISPAPITEKKNLSFNFMRFDQIKELQIWVGAVDANKGACGASLSWVWSKCVAGDWEFVKFKFNQTKFSSDFNRSKAIDVVGTSKLIGASCFMLWTFQFGVALLSL